VSFGFSHVREFSEDNREHRHRLEKIIDAYDDLDEEEEPREKEETRARLLELIDYSEEDEESQEELQGVDMSLDLSRPDTSPQNAASPINECDENVSAEQEEMEISMELTNNIESVLPAPHEADTPSDCGQKDPAESSSPIQQDLVEEVTETSPEARKSAVADVLISMIETELVTEEIVSESKIDTESSPCILPSDSESPDNLPREQSSSFVDSVPKGSEATADITVEIVPEELVNEADALDLTLEEDDLDSSHEVNYTQQLVEKLSQVMLEPEPQESAPESSRRTSTS